MAIRFLNGIDAEGRKIIQVGDPTNSKDAANKAYVDAHGGGLGPFLPLAGGTMTGVAGVVFPDAFKLNLGTGNDFQLYHDGNHGVLNNTTGNLYTSAQGSMMFRTSLNVTALTLDASQNAIFYGNVGIGTTAPGAKLDVSAGTNLNLGIRQLALDNFSNEGIGMTFSRTSSDADLMAMGVADTDKLGLFSRSGIIFSTGGSVQYAQTEERMRITSDGKVGIGTTSPSEKLEVSGGHIKITNSGNTSLYINANNSGSDATIFFEELDSIKAKIQHDASNDSMLFTDGSYTDTMTLKGGKVGIGTTSPISSLDVNGTISLSGETENKLYKASTSPVTGVVTNTTVLQGRQIDLYALDDIVLRTGTSGSDDIIFFAGDSEKARIKGSGNVGIGTTSPSQKLEVVGNIQATGTRSISSSFDANHYMRIESNSSGGILKGTDGGVITTLVRTYGDSYFNGGNVGIGTTSPGNKLEVNSGTTNVAGVFKSSDNQAWISVQDDDSGTYGALFGTDSDEGHDIVLADKSANKRLVIDTSGNVGIGTTSPNAKLVVKGSGLVSQDFFHIEDSGGIRMLEVTSDGAGNSNLQVKDTAGATKSLINSAGNSYFNGGNVGIGTTSPGSKLEVSSGAGANGDSILTISADTDNSTSSSNPKILMLQKGSTKTSLIEMDSSNRTHFSNGDGHYFSGGNVGIGTTSPISSLDVNGTISLSGETENKLYKASTSPVTGVVTNTTVLQGRQIDLYALDDIVLRTGTSGSDDIIFFAGDSEKARIKGSGNVGIGTTSPSYKLDVDGVVRGDRFFVGTNTAASQWAFHARNNNSTADSGLYFNNNSSEIYLRNSSNVIGARIRSNSASYFNGGDVGIGTASPQERLHVSGETHPSIKLSSSSDGNYNVILNCGYRNEALNLSVGGYKVFTTEGFNTPESTYLYSNNSKALYLASNQAATFTSTVTATNFINSSDERLKENIEEVRDNNVEVNWKTFNFKTEKEQKRYGVIAQELEKTNPEFVREDSQGFKSVAYIDLLIAKIAELEARIQKLEK